MFQCVQCPRRLLAPLDGIPERGVIVRMFLQRGVARVQLPAGGVPSHIPPAFHLAPLFFSGRPHRGKRRLVLADRPQRVPN